MMTSTEYEPVNIRKQHRENLAKWFAEEIIDPFLVKCKEAGMTDDEAVIALNENLFRETKGLNGF